MAWNRISFIAIFTVSALTFISAQSSNGKLQIDVHYESKCPDSRNFMKYQLMKAYPKFKDRLNINYVPFGKSQSFSRNGETVFECQHGERECDGNKFQSCALHAIGRENQAKQTDFVLCAMDFSKYPNNCAQNLGLDMNKINECVNGEKGIELQLQAEEYSKNVIARSGFVPTIVFKNQYKAGDFWASLDDFEGVVVDQLATL